MSAVSTCMFSQSCGCFKLLPSIHVPYGRFHLQGGVQPAGAALSKETSLSRSRARCERDAASASDVCLLCQRSRTGGLDPE